MAILLARFLSIAISLAVLGPVAAAGDELQPGSIVEGACALSGTALADPEQRGCCSWHGGVCGCSLGRTLCCDGALSPSCTCNSAGPRHDAGVPTLIAQDVFVPGYVRKDGTYVQPHMRSAPDSNPYNNYSTKGNVNPYTGQPGTKDPYSQPGAGWGSGSGGTFSTPYPSTPYPNTYSNPGPGLGGGTRGRRGY